MIGAADIGNCMLPNGEFNDLAGITPRAVSELFRLLNERTAQCTFEVCGILIVFSSLHTGGGTDVSAVSRWVR